MAKCMMCGKKPAAGNNVPKSVHKTRRFFRPNVQKVGGVQLCTRCMRTMRHELAAFEQVVAQPTQA